MSRLQHNAGLYDPSFEHDACGVGFVAQLAAQPTHDVVLQGLRGLANLQHRGATGGDTSSGDGAGVLIQRPDAFLRATAVENGISLTKLYASGLVFLPRKSQSTHKASMAKLARIASEEQCSVLGWRDIPVNMDAPGQLARDCAPVIRQVFVGSHEPWDEARFERALYVVRRRFEHAVNKAYIVSLSSRTMVYKGMFTGVQLREFYDDLRDTRVASKLAIVHQRFSTNTLPSWSLAQPFRFVAHNGEFNTVRGNINWMRTRQSTCSADIWDGDLDKIMPVVRDGELDSDTATFDSVLELLVHSGRALPHALAMMIPEAWQNNPGMDARRRAFYQYHACLIEAWDGPAAVAFSDGVSVGAMLDRNGLRPARYHITRDGWVYLASEAGTFDIAPARIAETGRIKPGSMLLVDTQMQTVHTDDAIKGPLSRARPYGDWLDQHALTFDELPVHRAAALREPKLLRRQTMFGYTHEELRLILAPMARNGEEPLASMGYDAPLAVLSDRPRLLFDYFKQAFAQVTNPPLDAIREVLVTALESTLGPEANLLASDPKACAQVTLPLPVLDRVQMAKLNRLRTAGLRSCTLDITFRAFGDGTDLQRAIEAVCHHASDAVQRGDSILILSDRTAGADDVPIPSLLATAAVHHHLIREGLRTRCGLVVDCGDAREVHHVALLLSYGAGAVHPHLACDSVEEATGAGAVAGYIRALCKGVLKVMSKMGICTLQSYCGAQLFEAIGIDADCITQYFTRTPSRLGGANLDTLAREAQMRHDNAYGGPSQVKHDDTDGDYQWRQRGEYHLFNPSTVLKLQHATQRGQYDIFKEYSALLDGPDAPIATLRSMLRLAPTREPIDLAAVEPVEKIMRRFATGAMSYGSISGEAHETLAVAMNRIGGRSNSGEGGEHPARNHRDDNGDSRQSAIRQVASGRFGVTSEFLANAQDIQIKVAQGAKPGEGGQLPGHKVVPWIAEVRHATPGVGLISPPPHHDIYSIEDLAQLIYDLKCANPRARILVKLVAAAGVGTIAAGVAKARADAVLISGYDGGTGAAPMTSLKHCGVPWELGLAETQQVLRRNGLRERIVVQADGHIKTGRDVVIAALLGAEEYGFSTSVLVVSGCIMMRVCHLNTCPVGIATQDPVLRKRFIGKPEFVTRYFEYVAEEVREYMATLGYTGMDEMIGDATSLRARRQGVPWKAKQLDLRALLHVAADAGPKRAMGRPVHLGVGAWDAKLWRQCRRAIVDGTPVRIDATVRNTDRTAGTRMGYELTRRHGGAGLPPHTLTVDVKGVAGQSFGAFLPQGISLHLTGEANDYVGKGLSGGTLSVRAAHVRPDTNGEQVILGNVALYGATRGGLYVAGAAGERFAVRNSGADAVVEGVGDHGCEYMTGGCVVVLGAIGRNFAAGMSGGTAYILGDLDPARINGADVALQALSLRDVKQVRALLMEHVAHTQSTLAKSILRAWRKHAPRFTKVMPRDYQRVLEAQERAQRRQRKPRAKAAHG